MSYQDWTPLVIRKDPNKKPTTAAGIAQAKAKGQVEVQKKQAGTTTVIAAHKLDDNEGADFKHQTVTLEFKLALQKARQQKGKRMYSLSDAAAGAFCVLICWPRCWNVRSQSRVVALLSLYLLLLYSLPTGWTQKDLGQKINQHQSVIQAYENGTAIPQGNIINQLNRVLGVVLPKIPKKKVVKENPFEDD